MANDTSLRESDLLSHESVCKEVASRSSEESVATKSERSASIQSEDVSMSDNHEIPEVPGRHKITTCKDVGFFAAASATHEAILSSCSDSETSNASGAAEGDDATEGMEHKSSSNILPLKNAARVSDLFRSGNEGNSCEGQISAVEGRESGISLNESLLLSVDLTTTDSGTICDVNDKNCYRQMVLRTLLSEDGADQSNSERSDDVPDVASAVIEDKNGQNGQEVQNLACENTVWSVAEGGSGYGKEIGRAKSDERTSKFKFVDLNCSSQDVFEDAKGSTGRNSGESLSVGQHLHDPSMNAADTTKISVEETAVNGVPDSSLDGVSNGGSKERHDQSFKVILPIADSMKVCDSDKESDKHLQKFSSGDSSTLNVDEKAIISGQAEELPSMEKDTVTHSGTSDNTACQLVKSDKSLKDRSVLVVEALFRAGGENSVASAVRAGLCFTAVFIILYAPSTILNILTLYLQLLVCAIFVDIFLN